MRLRKSGVLFLIAVGLVFIATIVSCEIGMGAAVDVSAPTIEISYPPKNAIIRDTFIAAGKCEDDMGIDWVKVTLINTETNQSYGPYEAAVDKESGAWTASINQKDESQATSVFNSYKQWQIPDGSYVINAEAQDKDGKKSPIASSPVSIDNTAPVLIVSKPLAVGSEAATQYGRSFMLAGDIAEEHETSKIILTYKNVPTGQENSIELNDTASMSSSNPLVVAKYYGSGTAMNEEKTALRNTYLSLYGNVDEIDKTNNVDKTYYCAFLLEDNARLYVDPSDAGSGSGNQTSEYYILSKEVSDLFGNTYSLDVAKLMQIMNGKSSYSETQISEITAVLSRPGNRASSTDITATASSKFTLNPNNSPVWAIDGYDVAGTEASIIEDDPNEEDDVFKRIHYTAGNILTLSIKAGRDNIYIKPNTVIAKLYRLRKDGSTYVRESVEGWPKTIVAEGEWTDPASDSATMQIALDISEHELTNGTYYEFDVTGEDRNKVTLEPEKGQYVFLLSANGAAPLIEFTEGLNRSWKKGADIEDSFDITGVITSSTPMHIQNDKVKIDTNGFTVKDNNAPSRHPTISYTYNSLSNGTGESSTKYPFKITLTPESAGGKLVDSEQSKYTYTISVKAIDDADISSNKVLTLYVDNKNPVLNVSGITPAASDRNGIITIKGTASDNESGLASLSYSVYSGNTVSDDPVTGFNNRAIVASNSWEESFNTTALTATGEGDYTIQIIAADKVGNKTQCTQTIHVKQSSDTPAITLSNAFEITADQIDAEHNLFDTASNRTLYGSVTDDDAVGDVKVYYKVSGAADSSYQEITSPSKQVNPNGKVATFSCILPGTQGLYDIKIEAIDTLGETSLNKKTITFPVAVNDSAPEFISVTPESSESNYVKGSLSVSGRIKDTTGAVIISAAHTKPVAATANPASAISQPEASGLNAENGAAWSDTINLPSTSGKYTVTYTATNTYGQTSTHKITYSVDVTEPAISNIKINNTDFTGWWKNGNIPLSATVTDADSGVQKVWYSLNGTDAYSEAKELVQSGNTWSANINIADAASQTIYIHAEDKLGNSPTPESVTVKIDNNPPTLGQKWYSLAGGSPAALTADTKLYINASQSVTVYGNYSDSPSGVKGLTFTLGGNSVTPTVKYSTAEIPASFTTDNLNWVTALSDSNRTQIKSWKAEFSSTVLTAALTDAELIVRGTDEAGNTVTAEGLAITKDTDRPDIVGITIKNIKEGAAAETEVYKVSDDTYYLRNKKDGAITIQGISTDNKALAYTSLEIQGLLANGNSAGASYKIAPVSKTDSNWSFPSLNMAGWSVDVTGARVTLKAYDKSGNEKSKEISLIFDETAPLLDDTVYDENSYTFRGAEVQKYSAIKIGQGTYSETSYGQLKQIAFTLYYKEEGSSFDEIEYQFLPADKTTAGQSFEWDDNPVDDRITGTLKVERHATNNYGYSDYHYYDGETEVHTGLKVTGSINGFEDTQNSGKKNLLLLRATDKCGNKSAVQFLKVLVDKSAPVIAFDDYSGEKVNGNILTNKKNTITLRGTVKDTDAGIKALRINLKDTNGTTKIFDTKNEISGLTTTTTVLASADMDNNPATEAEAVKVKLTNKYGSLTYSGYKAEPASAEAAPDCSLNSAAAFVKWELEIDPTKAGYTSYTEGATPSFYIDAEDWAEHSGTGNEANNKKIGSLLVDVTAPVVTITSPDPARATSDPLNGKQTIKGSVTDAHDLVKVSLYISGAATAPSTETGWGPAKAEIVKSDSVPVSKLYSFEFENININSYADESTGVGTAHILVVAEDIAGNKNAWTGSTAYAIDCDKDRPVVTISDETLKNGSDAISEAKPLMFTNSAIDFTLEDDDGIQEAKYKITKINGTVLKDWTAIDLSSSDGGKITSKITLPVDNKGKSVQGKIKLEFQITDNENTTAFTSTASSTLEKIKLKDTHGNLYGTGSGDYASPVLYLNVDTEDPIVTFEGITKISAAGAGTEITSGYANVYLGGTTTSAKVRFSAKDDGTNVKASSAQVKVELDDHDITGSPFAATPDTSTPDPDDFIVTIPCSTGDGSLTITVLAEDNAGKSNSDKKTFVLDNTKPEITITAPSETTYQSGATTGTGEFNEVCTLSYAISPIAPVRNAAGVITNSPATYTASTAFSYDYVGNTGSAESLGTGLNEKCGYVTPTDTKMKLFYIYFDGETAASSSTVIHSELMNDRIIDMGITTLDAIKRADNPFNRIIKLYMYIKAVDSAGNYSENVRTILVDPLGQRPVASIGYPSEDNLTLGGPITLMGTATGANPVSKVWVEVSENNGTSYGTPIEAEVKGSSWNLTINANGEYDPANADDTKNIKLRVHAVDSTNASSGYEYRTILIDKDTPVIDQNLKLVQWKSGFNGGSGSSDSGVTITTDAGGKGQLSLTANSYSALRNYTDKMSLKGSWFLIGKVSDTNGLKSIKINGTEVVSAAGGTYAASGTYVKPLDASNNYYFCIPIGDNTNGYVGEKYVDFIATENKGSGAKSVSKRFIVKVDNKAPDPVTEGEDYKIATDIKNENGFYTFGSVANENKVGLVEQTGVERVAFWFTRDTYSDKRLYDVMMQNDQTGNKLALTEVEQGSEGLYWKKKTGVTVSGAAVILTAADVNIHVGGLAKINGSIYRISTISADKKTITLEDTPGTATEAYFAVANVIDNPVEEGTGKRRITDVYGWGYYEDSDNTAYDDGDNMIEKLKQNKSNDGLAYYWSASINSRNLDDGPVVLHYVVFDKAGNYTTEQKVECTVKNNPPRIAGLKVGTDQNGDKQVKEADEEFITTYHTAINRVSALNESVTYPAQTSDTTPSSVITVKGKTIIQPEILGGNGNLKYTYEVSKRNAGGNGWEAAYYSVTSPVVFGVGTKSDDSAYATVDGNEGSELASILLPVSRFVCPVGGKTIEDAAYQKFTFSIKDSTPGRSNEGDTIESQTATISVIMNVDLRDGEPATNYIIPFYWKDLKKNSVYTSKSNPSTITDLEGHIELPADLNKAKKDNGTNIFTAAGTGVYSLNPKVSGKIKLEGIARDNSLLTALTATVNGTSLTLATYDYTATGYLKPANKTLAGDGWQVNLQKATYDEYKAAGYISQIPTGKEGTDTISYTSQKYGHVVHWTLILDTAKFLGTIPVKTGMVIKVEAADRGSPAADTITADDSSVGYASNNFADNGVTNPGQTGGTLGNTGYTCKYTVDVVPYISGIKTYLSSKSGKDDTSEFDRTALGHYPVSANETAYFYGFNLAKGASVTDSANHTRYLGAADSSSFEGFTVYPTTSDLAGNTKANVSTFTSGEVTVTVSDVPSLNNKNFNESQGSYGAAVPELSNYGKKATLTTFTSFYNRRPNSSTNYTLTDDVVLDIWQLNKEAAKPNPSGRVDEPIMRINPASGIIGFAFHSGPMHYAMPKGQSNSYNGKMEGANDGDYHAGNGFNYDENGNAYGLECGGDESGNNAPYYVHMVTADGSSDKKTIDRNMEGGLVLRYKLKSSSFAATDHGTTDGQNLYLAYYNSYNGEIRFRSGNSKESWGLFQHYDDSATTRHNAQVIACSSTISGYNNGGDSSISAEPLGNADEYVAIDVIKGDTKNNDVVVLVWYDGKDLLYAYNETPLKYEWRDRNNVADEKEGLNHRYWKGPITIFSGVGEYCQIKVDKQKGIHIAAHNSEKGVLKYAYLSSYKSTTVNAYDVDTKDNTGGHMTMDVALDTNNNPVPYISYTGANHPKLAYLVNKDFGNGASSDKFTGNWEITYIPTDSNVIDMDYKKRNNLDSRVNVGVWKDTNGVIKNSVTAASASSTNAAAAGSGTCWGNGTKNPVVGYQTAFDDANDRIETAQMK